LLAAELGVMRFRKYEYKIKLDENKLRREEKELDPLKLLNEEIYKSIRLYVKK